MPFDYKRAEEEATHDTPADVLKGYYPLSGTIEPLVELLRTTPGQAQHIIELAMVMGIQAALNRLHRDEQRVTDMEYLISHPETLPFWGGGFVP